MMLYFRRLDGALVKTRTAKAAARSGVILLVLALLAAVTGTLYSPAAEPAGDQLVEWLAPCAVALSENGRTVFIACAKAPRVVAFELAEGRVIWSCKMPEKASGLALAEDGRKLFVTCAGVESRICELDPIKGTITTQSPTGHTAMSPMLSSDGKTLYVCLRFNNQVVRWDTAGQRETGRIMVGREPVSVAPTADGKFLLVAHHLPAGRADAGLVAATVGVVDLKASAMVQELALPNGSSLLRQIRLSPDGRYAAVTHNLGRFQVPTTQLERGWMNTSALTIIDVTAQKVLNTVLLDEVDRGAANPWALAWNKNGERLFITHAGTHELSIIDFPRLIGKLTGLQEGVSKGQGEASAPANDLAFLVGLRERIQLKGNGPRSLAVAGGQVCVANYFSDSLEVLNTDRQPVAHRSVALQASPRPISKLREGERLFNDASICFQGWQSCGTCHSEEGRVDGLNWDLLNDGLGNPKNTKSLLLAHRTPPAMSTGVRFTAEAAVRAGLQHILFAAPSEDLAVPLDRWLASLKPIPSPFLTRGRLSAPAERGRELFNSPKTGCASCHKPGLFTDLTSYDVGTAGPLDGTVRKFDTPTLVELWRTAPYLHDGSAATLPEVLTAHNPHDRHGRTSRLSETELNDLTEYLLSL